MPKIYSWGSKGLSMGFQKGHPGGIWGEVNEFILACSVHGTEWD